MDHWAFQVPVRSEVPMVAASPVVSGNPIDAFILHRLQKAEAMSPSPEADPHTLLRRLYLDLTGLIPSPEKVADFLVAWESDSDAAWRAEIDGLLSSPHFGERWGRHWLDLARYGDSDGYLGDTERAWAWRYRDWVVAAINRDQPYDQFSIEQLAGDLLPDSSVEQKIATGFHRNSLRNTEAGVDKELHRTKEVIDRVNATATTWLALTLACAECHDHKHDPLKHTDFFQFYAFFNNLEDNNFIAALSSEAANNHIPPVALEKTTGSGEVAPAKSTAKKKKSAKPPKPPTNVQALTERRENRRESFVHIRGDYTRPGEGVRPGTPEVLHPLSIRSGNATADRLDLANWLFDTANPLTARVAVNQIWQHLFGVGLVATSDDFGTEGAAPSHPELLDWLATEYRRLGWSRKALIRLIVNSSTYRQSSALPSGPDLESPDNSLLWRQNSFRVDAEVVRDIHLTASGLLSRKMGGKPIYPPLPGFVTEVGRSVKWPESKGEDRYRRGLYIFLKRTILYPTLIAFDAPETDVSCSRRDRSNSPMQALALLNDPVFHECAGALGNSLLEKHGKKTDDAIVELYKRCLNRPPDKSEVDTLLSAYADFATESDHKRALAATARIVLNLDEFITRD